MVPRTAQTDRLGARQAECGPHRHQPFWQCAACRQGLSRTCLTRGFRRTGIGSSGGGNRFVPRHEHGSLRLHSQGHLVLPAGGGGSGPP
eukprot:3202373-Amphidinium_carterae.1